MKIELEGELDLVWSGSFGAPIVDVIVGGESLNMTTELEQFVGKQVRLTVEIEEVPA